MTDCRNESRPERRLTVCVVGSARSRHVCQRAAGIARLGHRVVLITDEVTGRSGLEEVAPRGLRVRGLRFLSLPLAYYRAIRACRPDLVHVHYADGVQAWVAGAGGWPLVVSTMGGDILFGEQAPSTPLTRWLTRRLLHTADLVTAKSDALATLVRRLAEPGPEVIKVAWGVETRVFHRRDAAGLRRRLGIGSDDPVILSPKILQPFYNIHLIVEALPRIHMEHPAAHLVVTEYAADPDYLARLQAQVERLGLQRFVHFVGELTHEGMAELYSAATVAVAVPPSDGLPQAMLEAMACGLPNVLSRLERYREFVTHEQTAYFVDLSADSIAEGVSRLLRDPGLRERIAGNGLALVRESANFESDVERVERHYQQLLSRPRRRRGWWGRGVTIGLVYLHLFAERVARVVKGVPAVIRRLNRSKPGLAATGTGHPEKHAGGVAGRKEVAA